MQAGNHNQCLTPIGCLQKYHFVSWEPFRNCQNHQLKQCRQENVVIKIFNMTNLQKCRLHQNVRGDGKNVRMVKYIRNKCIQFFFTIIISLGITSTIIDTSFCKLKATQIVPLRWSSFLKYSKTLKYNVQINIYNQAVLHSKFSAKGFMFSRISTPTA